MSQSNQQTFSKETGLSRSALFDKIKDLSQQQIYFYSQNKFDFFHLNKKHTFTLKVGATHIKIKNQTTNEVHVFLILKTPVWYTELCRPKNLPTGCSYDF